jgi:hypothetical protein
MVSQNDGYGLRLPPPWISPAAGMPDREVRPVIIVQRRRLLYPSYVQDYLDRVTAADVAAGNTNGLEVGVTDGANTFIQDLVSDTYLGVSGGVISQAASVIKASVPMAGARTRLGAMTPLVGPAPTSFNFGNNDYNRKTGLLGNGLDTYLDSNRNNNADPQNNHHLATHITTTGTGVAIGGGTRSLINIGVAASNWPFRSRNNGQSEIPAQGTRSTVGATGLIALSRSSSSSFISRLSGANETITSASATASTGNIGVFARIRTDISSVEGYSTARLAFYSIGESLDLAILDARVTALISAYATAIP